MRGASMLTRAAAALCAVAGLTVIAAGQMPDARQMSGIPMPTPDAPPGSVSVRLVRGELTNNIAGHRVELRAGARTDAATTDENGRATFTGLVAGTSVRASAEVDGERLESQTFEMPAGSGVRLVLVAGAGASRSGQAGTSAAAPVGPGEVVFGGDSRIQIEFDDDALEVFYLFELVNPSSSPVRPAAELAFDLPEGAQQAALLEGSSTQATVRGRAVTITGPVAPGTTTVHVAFSLAPAGPQRTIVQRLPVAWARVQVIMTRAGAARISSPQLTATNDMASDSQAVVVGTGPALPPHQEIVLTLSGLPSRSRWGRNVALALAALVLLAGLLAAVTARGASGDVSRMAALTDRRDLLMADLVRVEEQRRAGTVDENRYAARHADLVAQLERVYGELDRQPGLGEQG